MGNGEWRAKRGLSWMHRKFRCWTVTSFVLVTLVLVNGNNDICEQQEQSSFRLKRLSPSSKSKEQCSELCCKETACSIPLVVRKHCYGVYCAKKELCQVVFEQLKDFEGHRVDKRDADDDDEDGENNQGPWEKDQRKALDIYQNRTNLTAGDDGFSFYERDTGTIVQDFPAYLIARTKRGLQEDRSLQPLNNQSFFPQNQTNKFFVLFNNSTYDAVEKAESITKRSNDEEDDSSDTDDDLSNVNDSDGEDSSDGHCSSDTKFHESVIPRRKRNYHFKKLQRRSKSLKSCSEKCCKTDSCILSFMLENSCFGVLCSGDGDCHVRKDNLPRTSFELSIMKRDGDSEDGSSENDEQKRSTVQAKNDSDGDDDDDDDDNNNNNNNNEDDDVDGEIDDDDEEEEKKPKLKKHAKRHKQKKKSKKHTSSRRRTSHKAHKSHIKKHKHKEHSNRKRRQHAHKMKKTEKVEDDREDNDHASGDSEVAGKDNGIKKQGVSDGESVIADQESRMTQSDETERYNLKYDENGRKYAKNEYSDDLQHLIERKKPMNSTLFDDAVVGTEMENNFQDQDSSLNYVHENPYEHSEAAIKPYEDYYEDNNHDHRRKNPEEERAGMADESMKMRMSSVENDKRSDLMIAHRRFEDTGEAFNHGNQEDRYNEDRVKPNDRFFDNEYNNEEYHAGGSKYRHREDYHRNDLANEGYQHVEDGEYRSKDNIREHSPASNEISHSKKVHSEENDENEMSGSGERQEKHVSMHHDSQHSTHHDSQHSKQFRIDKSIRREFKSKQKGPSHSHMRHSSRHKSHSHKSKKGDKKKSSRINKEEKLIEKLEHLEEKIEKKQKTSSENSKEKILKKVESLANKLEKKTSGETEKRKRKKDNKDKSNKTKKGKKKSKSVEVKESHEKQKIDGKITEVLENSGDSAGHAEDSPPEQIIIPPGIHHHKKSAKKSSKTKHHHESKPPKEQKVFVESSGEGSASSHVEGSSSKTLLESSGNGEDQEGVAHYLSYERDHKVEDTNWPSSQIVVPYSEKRSHSGLHHSSHRMPILNENMVDGLDKIRQEKKDKIAKPSIKDKKELRNKIKKEKSKANLVELKTKSKKSDIELGHKKRKSHSKVKNKKKDGKKLIENSKLMKEFEKYKAFMKAQELAASGAGSGDQGSGAVVHQKIYKMVDKKRPKKKKKKKAKHFGKQNKKKESHKQEKKKDTKKIGSSVRISTRKHFEELVASGYSQDHGSGGEESSILHNNEGKDKVDASAGKKKKEKNIKQQQKNAQNSKQLVADKKSETINTSNSVGSNSTLNVSSEISQRNNSFGMNEKKQSPVIDDRPKLFHDRKETTAGDDASNQKPKSLKGTTNALKVNDTSTPRPKVLGEGNQKGEVISERNTSWSHSRADGASGTPHTTKNAKVAPALNSNSKDINQKNRTAQIQEPSIKRIATTHKITPKVEKPTKKATKRLVTTKPPTTTIATTVRKRKTTVRRKPKKVKTTPTTKMTTTSIPTLNILTGDDDVEPVIRPTKHKTKQNKNTHASKKEQAKKPSNPNKKSGNEGRKNHIKGNDKGKGASKSRTTARPIENQPVSTALPIAFLPPTIQPIVQPNPAQQQFPGKGGSSGILGDLQLPEPPGNGNRASGPPFYGQQGVLGNLPVHQRFGPMQYGKIPAENPPAIDHNELIYGEQHRQGSAINSPQNVVGGVSEVIKRPFSPTMNTFPASQYFGYSPMEKPTTLPFIEMRKNRVRPSVAPPQKMPQNNAHQSPAHVIQRILGVPHKLSPLNVIQNILKPKHSVHKENQGTEKPLQTKHPSPGKEKSLQRPSVRGQNSKGLNTKGQHVKVQKTTEKKNPPPNQANIKSPPTGKKSLNPTHPLKNGRKQPLGRLNDFFKSANSANLLKTTVAPQKIKLQNPPQKKVPESTAPINPKEKKDDTCPIRQNLPNMVLMNGRKSGVFTKMQGYPPLDVCIKQCCKTPTCDLLFKSGEVCYLVKCHNPSSCKTEPLKEPTMRTRIVYVNRPEPKAKPAKHVTCEGENAFGISWKETKPDNFAARSCPRKATGMAKRHCNDHAQWLAPDFSDCVSGEYTELNENAKHLGFTSSVKDILANLEEITTQTIDNSLIFGGDIIKATNILEQVSNYAEKNHIERFGFGALRNFARSSSNLLDETNKQEWENVNRSLKGPGKIMNSLEKFGVITAGKIPLISNNQPIVTNNLIMSVARLSKIQKYIFPNYSMPYLKKWTTKRDHIVLPGYLFKSGPVKVASINYKTLAHLLPHQWSTANHVTFTDGFRMNSKVIATSINPEPTQKISPPVTIILHHLKEINTARTKCVHWDFKSNIQNGGSWSSEGCWVVTSNATVTVCQCDHLTHFAVLMNLSDEDRISAKEQAKENTFALMWLGIPVLVVLSVGAMYTCFAWSKAPRRRHVVVKDGKPRLPEDDVIVTKTVKENFPGSPNRYLYSSYTSPNPSDLEWEHVWDFLTNSEFENWQCSDTKKRKKFKRKRLDLRPSRLLQGRKKKLKDKFETSEYFSEGDSSSNRWKNQDDNEWSRERIKCLGKGIIDLSSEASHPVDSLEEFSDDTSVADSKDGDKSSNSFDNFTPDAISSPHSAYGTEPKFYSFVYRSHLNLKEGGGICLSLNTESRLSAKRGTHYSSCSSLDTLRSVRPSGVQKTKYASTTCLLTIGQKGNTRFCDRKCSSRISLATSLKAAALSMSSGFLDKTWSSKYASSLSISTIARSLSTKTINEDIEGFTSCHENTSSEQGYGTFESSSAFSNDVMEMNITSSDVGLETDSGNVSRSMLSNNIPTYDMNLLTPSKKARSLNEKPIESSSLDNLCLEDFDNDIHMLESIIDENSSFDSKSFLELRRETRELLKQTYIMNMDLIGNDTETKESRKIVEFGGERTTQKERRVSSNKSEMLNNTSSIEDLGIDLSVSIGERSPHEGNDTEILRQAKVESKDWILSTDSEANSPVANLKFPEAIKRSEKAKSSQSACRSRNIVSIPRTSTIKRKTKVTRKRAERVNTVVAGLASRSPTKHMRSYIVLRQQSRYSDHERQATSTAQEDQDSASGNDSGSSKRQRKCTTKVLRKRSKAAVKVADDEAKEVEDETKGRNQTANLNRTANEEVKMESNQDEEMAPKCDVAAKEGNKKAVCTLQGAKASESTDMASDIIDTSMIDEDEATRRSLETSVFGSTLKRWKGRSQLHSSQNKDNQTVED